MSDPVVLAVDGGNSKTIALVAGLDARVVGAGRAGNADVYTVGEEAALASIEHAVSRALAEAGVEGGAVVQTVCSLAGADWPEDFAMYREGIAARLGLPAEPLVVNDAIGALWTGTSDGEGVAVVVGTGGAIGARNKAGDVYHLGFWPDGTGAGELGRQAVRAVERAAIGLAPPTLLETLLTEAYGAASSAEIVRIRKRRNGPPVPAFKALAPLVLDAAAADDEVALRIVLEQGALLGDYARVSAERVGLVERFPLVLAGGVLRHGASALLSDAICARLPGGVPVRPVLEPVGGALLWALERAGAPTPDDLHALHATLPDALFVT